MSHLLPRRIFFWWLWTIVI